jgi:Fe-S-cluster containining protein
MRDAQTATCTEDGHVYYDMADEGNPCFGCGACCTHFRVSFYHGELDTQPGGYVPAELTTQLTPFRACMKGTEAGQGRCIALKEGGRCGIYEQRPSVCREFPVFMDDGSMNPECLRLRALYNISNKITANQQ